MKKLTAILLIMILAFSVLPVRAFADYDGDYDYADDDDDDDDGDLPDKPIVDVYTKSETLDFFDTDNFRFIVIEKGCCLTVADDEPFENGWSIVIERGGKLIIESADMEATRAAIICEGELEIAEGASLTMDYRSRLLVLENGKLTVKGDLNADKNTSVYCFGRYKGEDVIPKAEIAGAVVFRRDYEMVDIYDSFSGRRREWMITDKDHEIFGGIDAKMLPQRVSTLREQSYTDSNMDFIFLSSGEDEYHVVFILTDGRMLEMAIKGFFGKTVSICGVRLEARYAPLDFN